MIMNTFRYFTSPTSDLLSLTIESERLLMVTISNRFEQDIFQEFTNEITVYMFPSPAKDIEETRSFIAESRCAIKSGNNLQFAIVSKATKEFLGCCGLHGEGKNGEDKVRTPELGIWLKKSAHGSGYGREAIHTLVNWSRKNIDIDYFIYPVDRRNIASCKIPESLGGQVVEEFKAETSTGKILDKVVYRIN